MTKLTETVCIKVSKDTKKFLDTLDNHSLFIRNLIIRSKNLNNDLDSVTTMKTLDGDEYIEYDEEKLNKMLTDLSKSIMEEMFTHSINKK